jgi:hypothetical protein
MSIGWLNGHTTREHPYPALHGTMRTTEALNDQNLDGQFDITGTYWQDRWEQLDGEACTPHTSCTRAHSSGPGAPDRHERIDRRARRHSTQARAVGQRVLVCCQPSDVGCASARGGTVDIPS